MAAGKIADAGILFFLELDERDGFVCAWALIEKAAEEAERFEYGKFFGELRVLQLNAKALAELVGVGVPVHAEQFDIAGIGSGEAFADFDGRSFSCAAGAEEAEAFAGANFEVETVDGDDVLVGLAQTCDAKCGLGNDGGHGPSIAFGERTCNCNERCSGIGRWIDVSESGSRAALFHGRLHARNA